MPACGDRGPDLLAHALGQLPASEAAVLESHLAGCAACRAERERLARESASLPRAELEPPPEILDRLLLTIADEAAERRVEAAVARGRACAGRGEDLVALALGELPKAAAAPLLAHLSDCAACAAEHEATGRLAAAARSAPGLPLPEGGASRLLDLVRAAPGERDLRAVPAPARRRRPALRVLGILLPAAAAAAVLAALTLDQAEPTVAGHLERGSALLLRAGSPDAGGEPVAGAFDFALGDELEAGREPAFVRFVCPTGGDRAAVGAALPDGVVELRLDPGARVARLREGELELRSGRVAVRAGRADPPFVLRRGELYAAVRGTRFVAATAGGRLFVAVDEGRVELGRDAGARVELGAGEEGVVDADTLERAERGAASLFAPTAALRLLPPAPAGPDEPLRLVAELRSGRAGPLEVMAFDESEPRFLVRLEPVDGGAERRAVEIKVQRSMLEVPPPGGRSSRTFRLDPSSPYALRVALPAELLGPGRWEARLRYLSYRARSNGSEWLGSVESEPVTFTIPPNEGR